MKKSGKYNQHKKRKILFNLNAKVNSVIGTKRDEFGSKGSTKGTLNPRNKHGNPVNSWGAARMEPRRSNMGPMGRQGEKKK